MRLSIGTSVAIYTILLQGLAAGTPSDHSLLVRKALPNSPHGYTPADIACPGEQRPSVREASSLSSNEAEWLERRRRNTMQPMRELLSRLSISGFSVDDFFNKADSVSALPNIAISFSGGGYRALLNGAGVMAAFDSRTENATSRGRLGGLLQSATYVAGLSGGAWLTGSIFINNFTTVTALRDDKTGSVWDFRNSILSGPAKQGIQTLDTKEYYQHLFEAVSGKTDAGFDTTLTDYWGRALSFQLINATFGGPDYTWSSIALTEDFQNGNIPMPIVLATERAPGEKLIARNSTVFEFNPFEMGSWDPTTFGFVDLRYLGSKFSAGSLRDDAACLVGFDNAGFIMGTTSSLFNAAITTVNTSVNAKDIPQPLKDVVSQTLGGLGSDNEDIADYPNPFFQFNELSNPSADSSTLTLADGGLDFQNIPFHPVIQPGRNVDVIFAVDSSADTVFNFPNGTALVATYERSQSDVSIANGTAFPSIPDVNTMVNLGLNTRPTFFGCDANNITTDYVVPLVVYIPLSPYVFYSNVSTFETQEFDDSVRDAIIQNGYDVATMGNSTVNGDWPTCVGCAILLRSLARNGVPIPDVCATCLQNFCWDGSLNSTEPANYNPPMRLTALKVATSAACRRRLQGSVALPALAALIAAIAALQ